MCSRASACATSSPRWSARCCTAPAGWSSTLRSSASSRGKTDAGVSSFLRKLLAALLGELQAAARVDVLQPGLDHRGLDGVARAAVGARQALAGAQAVDRALQVADRHAGLGLRAHRTQRLAQLLPALRELGPGLGVVRMHGD